MQIQDKLLNINKLSRPGIKRTKAITNIVIHWVGNANSTAIANRNYFDKHERYASAHYIIGLQGEIIRCIPDNEIAWHGHNANDYSIGIENCHPDWEGKFNDKTYASLIELCAYLCKKYKLDPEKALLRHYDCPGANHKDCPHYYVKHNDAWKQFKQDVKNAVYGNSNDKNLEQAVSKIIKSGISLEYDKWKREDLINLNYVPNLISKMGGFDQLVSKAIITDKIIWQNHKYTKSNVVSLLIKYASKL